MTSVLNSSQVHQRLRTRLEYLVRQYETLENVAEMLAEVLDSDAPRHAVRPSLRNRLEEWRTRIETEDMESSRRELGLLGSSLYEAQEKLHEFDSQISVYQIRTRFQNAETSRDEISLRLQFMLSKLNFSNEDLDKIDYLTTRFYAQFVKTDQGFAFENRVRREYQRMLDYAGIAKTDVPDPEGMEFLNFLREELTNATSLQQLTSMATLDRLRTFKAGLQNRRLHPDVMLELARVNLLAGERFEQLTRTETRRLDKLASQLISAGISEVEEAKGDGTVTVEEAWKSTQRDASLLNDDYKRNKLRIARLANTNTVLAKASERLGLAEITDDMPEPEAMQESASQSPVILNFPANVTHEEVEAPQVREIPQRLRELELTPQSFQQNLCARLSEITRQLSESDLSDGEIRLSLKHTDIELADWEAAAFQNNHPGLRAGVNSLSSFLRLSVALMSELKEKQETIALGIDDAELRAQYINSARYLEKFGVQTIREISRCTSEAGKELPADICGQIKQTQLRLARTCAEFSATIRNTQI